MKENAPDYPDLSVSRDSLLRLIYITDDENTFLIYFAKCLIYAKFYLFNTSVAHLATIVYNNLLYTFLSVECILSCIIYSLVIIYYI